MDLVNNAYAQLTLNTLANLVNNNNVIHYYNIAGTNIDDVLEIFVRTNSGGYTLKKGDLLMSALTVNWANAGYSIDARVYVEDIIDDIERIGYKIDKDWVFNAFLMLTGANIGLKVSSFMFGTVASDIYNNHPVIRECISKAFSLVSAFHLPEKGLTTKLAVLPVVYYLYTQKLNKTAILPTNHMQAAYSDMRKFLFRAIVQNLFEAGTDETLKTLRTVIDQKASKTLFPYADIQVALPKLIVTYADVQSLLQIRRSNAFPVLSIIYALGYDNGLCTTCPSPNEEYDVDHMHPKKSFEPANLAAVSFSTPNDQAMACDGITFDTVLNLELLDAATNRSKNKQPLKTWLRSVSAPMQSKLPKDHFFYKLPIDLADFGTFITKREQLLLAVLKYL